MSKAFTREDNLAAPEIIRRQPTPLVVHLTPEGAERLRSELVALQSRHAAGDGQTSGSLEARIHELQQTLAAALIVQPECVPGVVRFGSTVTVRDSDGDEEQYRLVGSAEIDLGRGWISSGSPLAKALLNRKAGERVTFKSPSGERAPEIISVS